MNHLRMLRKQKRMTQMELGVRALCSMTTILKIEKYAHYPNADCRQRIASALCVSESDIWSQQLR